MPLSPSHPPAVWEPALKQHVRLKTPEDGTPETPAPPVSDLFTAFVGQLGTITVVEVTATGIDKKTKSGFLTVAFTIDGSDRILHLHKDKLVLVPESKKGGLFS